MPERTTAIKAIRLKCLDCSNGSSLEVSECPISSCPIYPYRMGHNPYIERREMTEEQRAEMTERLRKARENSGRKEILRK